MPDRTSECTIKKGIPQLNHSSVIIKTPSDFASSDTINMAGYFSEIWMIYIADATGVVKTATFSALVITAGTLTTGTHFLKVDGVKT